MKKIFSSYQIELTDVQMERFQQYYDLLVEWNQKINLTAITEYEEVIKKHFLDSCLLLCKYPYELFKGKRMIDVGTGAGFPGIPLALLLPKTQFTLVDSLNKRVEFLLLVIQTLQLENVEVFHGRAEDLGRDKYFREQYDYCVSRAVAELPLLLEYCSPFIKVNGRLLLYKSKKMHEEIEKSNNALQTLNCQVKDNKLLTSDKEFERYMLEIEKIKSTPEKYPRKAGKPKKKPL